MKLSKYINERGLFSSHVAKQMGVSRQQIDEYGNGRFPTLHTLIRIADAMTTLGSPTTVADISTALIRKEEG